MLKTNAANMLAMKRKVCVYKAQGKMKSAIRELTNLLQTFQTDIESWKELVTLYMAAGDMKKALYCQEEVILGDPHNYQNHNRYGDILYTLGGEINVRCSRRHFAQSLELSPENNLRAIYGLALSCYTLSSITTSRSSTSSKLKIKVKDETIKSDEKELNQKLFEKSMELLRSNYSKNPLSKQIERLASKLEKTNGQNEKATKRHGGVVSKNGSNRANKKSGNSGSSKESKEEVTDVGDID
jgi:tetratricopeptide (TPR) repeat protein